MAINKRKVLEAARKHAQKGAQAKALKEFGKLLKLDPRDARLRLEVGDAHRRWGNIDEAIDTYAKVADQYMKEGFDARAVAVYKQIQNLNPEAYESYEPLAELYQRMGLPVEAIQALQTAADGYNRQGKKPQALELLRRTATLDPSNTTSRIKVADLLHQENLDEEAINEYNEAAVELERQGDSEGVASVCERILEIEPGRIETVTMLAQNLLSRDLPDQAEPLAKRALQADSQVPEYYELLASVYRAQQRDDELVDTYRQLSELFRQRGDEGQARDILQRYVPASEFENELGIDDNAAFGAMGTEIDLGDSGTFDDPGASATNIGAEASRGDAADQAEETQFNPMALETESHSKVEDDFFLDEGEPTECLMLEDIEPGGDDLALELDEPFDAPQAPAQDVPVEKPQATPQAAPQPKPSGDPEQLLAEASVYLRYGKRDRAIANLEAIVEQVPAHRAAHEKLGEAHADAGEGAKAVAAWLTAAGLARDAGDDRGLSVLRDRIHVIDPEAAGALIVEAPTAAPAEAAAPDGAPGIDFDDIEIELDDADFAEDLSFSEQGDELDFAGEDEVTSLAQADSAESSGPGASSSMVQQISEDLEEADFYMKQGLHEEAEVIFQRVLSIAPNHPHALVRLGEVAAARGEDPGATSTASPHSGETAPDLGEEDELVFDDDLEAFGDDQPATLDEDGADVSVPEAQHPTDTEIEFDDSEFDLAEPAGVAEQTEPDFESIGAEESAGESAVASSVSSAVSSDTELEDDLAAQFLSEVTGSQEIEGVVGAGAEGTPDDLPESEELFFELSDDDTGVDAAAEIASEIEEDSEFDLVDGVTVPADDDTDLDKETEVALETNEDAGIDAEAEIADDSDDGFASLEPPVDALSEAPDLDVPRPAESDLESGFDLAAELNDSLDADENSGTMSGLGDSADGFAAVFSEFKQGVSRTLSEGDHEAHFDLGIAYREMGLFDDAKDEFRSAMQNPARELECRHMLGLCALEQEHYEEAVAEFEQIVAGEGSNPEQTLTAQFELGRCWEAIGEIGRARGAYEAVAAVDATFCEVSTRLASLEEPEKPEAEIEGGFESFEDLMGDDGSEQEPVAETAVAAAPEYESFEDFLSEEEDAGEGWPAAAAAPEAEEPALPVEEAAAEPEVDTEPPEPPPAKKKRRKKISFF